MGVKYLKRATKTSRDDAADVNQIVKNILDEIETGGEEAAREYAAKFDQYSGPLVLGEEEIAAAGAKLSQRQKADIRFAHDNVRRFAELQRSTISEAEIELNPGFHMGQKLIPIEAVGCYIPGGRYAHIASAIMTITTARIAGCGHITACSPPRGGEGGEEGIAPAIIYAAHLAGADRILAMGGVQGVAAMVFGLFDLPKAKLIAGPGNQFVAEAKRLLYGRVGIDMIAGPTDSLIVAEGGTDAKIIATDLVSQAEHGYNSPVWLISDDRALCDAVMELVPGLIDALPKTNRENAKAAWRDYAEVILCETREEMAASADEIAPEHLTIMAGELDWWLSRLKNYGSLFLGEEVTVTYGDKAAGTNHVLPTSGAANYTGGLSVHKFLKIVTWQRASPEGSKPVAEASARISRLEGMEAHARAADVRLDKFFPDEKFDLSAEG